MKQFIVLFIAILGSIYLTSCDKIDNPFPPAQKVDLDTTIYPGNWSDYVANEWPDFSTIPAITDRNVLIEDFTGHNCSYCPSAAAVAHGLVQSNPDRVFVASIHASNTVDGMSSFQAVNAAQGYTLDFTNPNGLALGSYFGNTLVNSGFFGNPAGTISRTNDQGEYFPASGSWSTKTAAILSATLRVGIKAHVNYFETPKHGYFLHTEINILDNTLLPENLAVVVYLLEDSLVAPQNVGNTYTPDYVHRDVFRGTIDNQLWGRTLSADYLKNGKYYLDYSAILSNQLDAAGTGSSHNADNMHLVIYVYDKNTLEILQVVEEKFL